jgi:nucleotide-binding universal stress UspA family protein
MLPEIKKVMFTTDLSKESRKAFDYAVSLAAQYGAKLTILHVMEDYESSTSTYVKSFIGDERWQELQEGHQEEARKILIGKQKEGAMIRNALNEFCDEAQKDHAQCDYEVDDIVVTKGKVVDEILNEVQTRNCDVVVMGHHVRGKLEEAVLGSTTRRVLRRGTVPVMLVRLEENA